MRPSSRSKIANGRALHAFADGRTREARRWRDVYLDVMRRTGNRNETLCRSLASAILAREALDARLARGEDVDAALLIKLSGEIRRLTLRLHLDEEPPVEDVTAEAIALIRAGSEARP